ncbi:MAG: NUDIX domain-containing protein [Dehalococcoidia bacterium]|nr:NUDIX domain-containing protein [Dehalococcoidia bacterium]
MQLDPAPSEHAPRLREAARVVLLDGDGRVLLFRVAVPGRDSGARPLWITPGGGRHLNESFEAAAARELWEETGIETTIAACVWTRDHTFSITGRRIRQCERYFLARAPHTVILDRHRTAAERAFLAAHRWWTLAELAASTDAFVPRRLAALLEPLLRGEIPPAPLDAGV